MRDSNALQLTTPLLFIMLPISTIGVCMLGGFRLPHAAGQLLLLLLALYPLANSCLTLCFVGNFRRLLVQSVGRLLTGDCAWIRRNGHVSTTSALPSTDWTSTTRTLTSVMVLAKSTSNMYVNKV